MELLKKTEEMIILDYNNNPKATGFINDLNKTQNDVLVKFKERLIKVRNLN